MIVLWLIIIGFAGFIVGFKVGYEKGYKSQEYELMKMVTENIAELEKEKEKK